MKIWFDTEFIEDGHTIDLMSIGMIREDGETAYWEILECDLGRADDWVMENVIPNLTGPALPRKKVAWEVQKFVGVNPEFWAYYCSYDWIALCQLYGKMINLPDGWPMFCMDVMNYKKFLDVRLDFPTVAKVEHNALSDAIWTKEMYYWLKQFEEKL